MHTGIAIPIRTSLAAPVRFTCPMHPAIARDAPGACTICGMALEPAVAGGDADENAELAETARRFWWSLAPAIAVLAPSMSGAAGPPATVDRSRLALPR